MKPYEKYKESGLSFLEKIPEKWRVQKIKFFVNIYNGDSLNDAYKIQFESYNLDDLAYISSKDIDVDNSKVQYENGLRIPKDFGKFKIAPTNSILICIEGGSAGKKIAFTNQPVHFVNKLACLNTINGESSKFLFYSLKANLFQSQFKNSIAGLIGGVSISNLKNFYLTIPPLQEQTAIAKYLDHQTAIIDELIEKKTKQIALLKEKRQAIINETVTKGLDPTAKMKDSGIEWLGEIPESWEGTKMKFLGSFINGYAFKSDEFLNNGTLRVIKISNIQHMEFDWADESFVNSKYLYDNMPCQVRKGDLVFALTRPIISTGIKASVVDFDEVMVLNQRNAIFRSNSNVLMSWIYYTMLSHQFIEQFDSKIDKTGQQPNISTSDISNISITLPPIKVQEEICEILKVKIKNITYSESQIRLAIEKLKEYRQSLISEAVTGKIDVRGWGALIQEEA